MEQLPKGLGFILELLSEDMEVAVYCPYCGTWENSESKMIPHKEDCPFIEVMSWWDLELVKRHVS